MKSDRPLHAVFSAMACGGVVVPVAIAIVRAVVGLDVALVETVIGAVIGTSFLASTALLASVFLAKRDLKTVVVYSYVVKISILLILGLLMPTADFDRDALGIAIVASAIAYLMTVIALQPKRAT